MKTPIKLLLLGTIFTFCGSVADAQSIIYSNSFNGKQFILSGTNGFAGDGYYLLSSTNLASGQWTADSTNTFNTNGTFNITNIVTPEEPQEFFRLQLQ